MSKSKWETLAKGQEPTLEGIDMAVEQHDGVLHSVTLTDRYNNQLRIGTQYSNLQMLVPAKPKMKKQWQVKGALGESGSLVFGPVDEEYKAQDFLTEMVERGFEKLKVEEIEAPEES